MGVFALALGLLAWLGQLGSALAPGLAARFGLTEPEADVDPALLADIRAEAAWDSVSLWPLPLGAMLLLLGDPSWKLFGLGGGAIYLYFAGRGIAQRWTMQRCGIRIGGPSAVKTAYLALALWGAAGAITVAFAVLDFADGLAWR